MRACQGQGARGALRYCVASNMTTRGTRHATPPRRDAAPSARGHHPRAVDKKTPAYPHTGSFSCDVWISKEPRKAITLRQKAITVKMRVIAHCRSYRTGLALKKQERHGLVQNSAQVSELPRYRSYRGIGIIAHGRVKKTRTARLKKNPTAPPCDNSSYYSTLRQKAVTLRRKAHTLRRVIP